MEHFEVFGFEGDEGGDGLEQLGEGLGGGEDGVGALSPAENAVGLEEVGVGVGGEDQGCSSESVEAEVGEMGNLGIGFDRLSF